MIVNAGRADFHRRLRRDWTCLVRLHPMLKASAGYFNPTRGSSELIRGLRDTQRTVLLEQHAVETIAPIPFAGSELGELRHVCAFFNSDDEKYRVGEDTVIDIMRTHPMIIIGGVLQQNPFFVPPKEFLGSYANGEPRRSLRHPRRSEL
jgi:hypothetical protein